MGKAITSVEGAKVVTAPKKGEGEHALTLAVVELSGKASLSSVTKALEDASTVPAHKAKCPPGVAASAAAKLKPEEVKALMDALNRTE